jgi:hypothetical protein
MHTHAHTRPHGHTHARAHRCWWPRATRAVRLPQPPTPSRRQTEGAAAGRPLQAAAQAAEGLARHRIIIDEHPVPVQRWRRHLRLGREGLAARMQQKQQPGARILGAELDTTPSLTLSELLCPYPPEGVPVSSPASAAPVPAAPAPPCRPFSHVPCLAPACRARRRCCCRGRS